MAFTTRSGRANDATSAPRTSNVGPGSYTPQDRRIEHGYAPFSSTQVRSLRSGPVTTAAYTPGPGHYKQSRSSTVPYDAGAPFSTTGPRLAANKSASTLGPGPGEYDGSKPTAKKFGQMPGGDRNRARVSIFRQKTAPSVPARTQVFGYEEDQSGRLVMQPPPDHGHTGMGMDRPGPMEYSPDKLRLMKCSPATGWAKSKAERNAFWSSSLKVPGPGEYQTNSEGKAAAPSSSFSTKVLRMTQPRPSDARAPPGPGDYAPTCRGDIQAQRQVPKQHQFFNSTQRRSSDVDPLKLRSAPSFWKDPGPGAYNAPSAFSRHSMSDPSCSAFNSTQAKLKMRPPEVPGPGAYDGGDEYSLFGSLAKRVASRNAQFGASGPRFPGQNPHRADGVLSASELPGPQSYSPERGAPAGPPQMSSTFASGTKRMQLPKPPTEPKASEFETDVEVLGDPRNLGPGSYEIRPRWQGKSPHGNYKPAPGFDGGMVRFPEHRSIAPPPGTYDLQDVNRALRPYSRTLAAFGVSDARLPKNSKYLPGPGEYNLVPGWQKRSYNITFDDTQLL